MDNIKCIYCEKSPSGMICTGSGYSCPNCLLDRIDKLEKENKQLRSVLLVIREKISDATFHGEASFSACLSYIDVLASQNTATAEANKATEQGNG